MPVSQPQDADQLMVLRAQKGDRRAFDLLVIKYQHRVASVVSRYLNEPDAVPDIVQEAFLKAFRGLASFRGDSAFYTWVYRIAINCANSYLEAGKRRPTRGAVDWDDAASQLTSESLTDLASPERLLSRDQMEQNLKQALDRLPHDLKVAVTLREFEGMSYEDIAHIMDTPIGTVRSRIFRARDMLERALHADDAAADPVSAGRQL